MVPIDPAEYRALMRCDFTMFAERCFAYLNPSVEFVPNWHIPLVGGSLERVRRGRSTRLLVNVPPRSMKSILASVSYPAWLLGHDPTAKVICVSYGAELSASLARDCRRILRSPWYRQLFPQTRLSPLNQAAHDFETTAGGRRISSSLGGVLTGFGGDTIIIDDPIKPDQARSDVEREAANEWFRSTLISRLNDKRTGRSS